MYVIMVSKEYGELIKFVNKDIMSEISTGENGISAIIFSASKVSVESHYLDATIPVDDPSKEVKNVQLSIPHHQILLIAENIPYRPAPGFLSRD